MTLTVGSAVEITSQPESGMYALGSTATFTVGATGDDLTYQWYYKPATANNFSKSSTTAATYSFTVRAAHNGYQYYCVVTDKYGNTEQSDTVTLTIDNTVVLDGVTYEPITTSTCKVVSYEGTAASLTIPETVENMTVVEIGVEAFMDNKQLMSIDLPDTITIIRARAFKGCTSLSDMR